MTSVWAPASDGTTLWTGLDTPLSWSAESVPRIMVIFGGRGTGKTLHEIYFCELLSQLTGVWRGWPRTIATNLETYESARHRDVDIHEELMKYPDWAEDLVIALDEITEYLPSKRPMSAIALRIESFMTMIRKIDCDVVATCQYPKRLTTAMRDLVDFYVKPVLHRGADGSLASTIYWWDWQGDVTGRAHSETEDGWPPRLETADWVSGAAGLEALFPLYDTNEVIVGPYVPERERLIALLRRRRHKKRIRERLFVGVDRLPLDDVLQHLMSGAYTEDPITEEEAHGLLAYLGFRTNGGMVLAA